MYFMEILQISPFPVLISTITIILTETEGPPLSITEQRRATILQELPFVIPFESRTQVFSNLVADNRSRSQMRADFNEGPMINVTIRRTHIYEDAFEKLSPSNGTYLCFINTYMVVYFFCIFEG